MTALLLPATTPGHDDGIYFRREADKRRIDFEFFDQLDRLDLSDAPRYIAEELEGAD